jgi:hypothetical protein
VLPLQVGIAVAVLARCAYTAMHSATSGRLHINTHVVLYTKCETMQADSAART